MNITLDMYNYKCNNGGYYEEGEKKMIKFDGDLENLTLPYYGFREVIQVQENKEIISYSNGMFFIDGKTKEITFEVSWLACNGYPDITVKDILLVTKMTLLEEQK